MFGRYKSSFQALVSIGALVVLAGVTPVQASVITYSDRSSFDSAVGATTSIDFDLVGPTGLTYYSNSGTFGDVTFTQPESRMFVFGEDFYNTNGLTSAYLSQNCCAPSGITATFAGGVFSVGMDLGVQENWAGSPNPNDIVMTTSEGDVMTYSASVLMNTTNTLGFFGFTSSTAITSIHFANAAEGIVIDNFAYTASGTEQVPEPATLVVFGLGLLGLGYARRKRAA